MTDDEIVAEYLASLARRRAFREQLAQMLLVDNTAPYEQLVENWTPLITFVQEMKSNDRTEDKPNTTVWKRV